MVGVLVGEAVRRMAVVVVAMAATAAGANPRRRTPELQPHPRTRHGMTAAAAAAAKPTTADDRPPLHHTAALTATEKTVAITAAAQ